MSRRGRKRPRKRDTGARGPGPMEIDNDMTVGQLLKARGNYKVAKITRGKNLGFHDFQIYSGSSHAAPIPSTGQFNGDGVTGVLAANGLLHIARGDGAEARNEDRIRITKLMLTGHLVMESTLGNVVDDQVRIMVVHDKRANGTLPAANLFLQEYGSPAAVNWDSYNNLYEKGRFTILWNKTFSLNNTGAGADGTTLGNRNKSWMFKKYLDINMDIQYGKAGTGVIADVISDNIFIYWISRNGVVYGQINGRLRFADIE